MRAHVRRSQRAVLGAFDALSLRRDEEDRSLRTVRSVSSAAVAVAAGAATTSLLSSKMLLSVGGAGTVFPSGHVLALSAAAKAPLVTGATLHFLQIAPVVACQGFWAAPWPTIKEVEKTGTTGGLPPLGYFSMFANGYLWMVYGYTADMNPTIIFPNFTGFLAGAYYSAKVRLALDTPRVL